MPPYKPFFVCFASLVLAAAAPPSAVPSDAPASAEVRARSAGTIEGDVVAIDYRSGTMTVRAGSRRLDVVVLPSTNIVGNDKFHTIADITKGTHVRVILSERGTTFIAQIVRLR